MIEMITLSACHPLQDIQRLQGMKDKSEGAAAAAALAVAAVDHVIAQAGKLQKAKLTGAVGSPYAVCGPHIKPFSLGAPRFLACIRKSLFRGLCDFSAGHWAWLLHLCSI